MKNHNKGQSTSIILEDDAGFNQFNDTLSLEDDPFFAKGPTVKQDHHRINNQALEMWNLAYQNKNEFNQFENNFNSQLLMSAGINQPNKDFAGETFSQISSTFEQQAANPFPSQPSQHKIPFQIEKSPQNIILTSKNEYKNINNDELLDFECLNKSSQNSPTAAEQRNYIKQKSNKKGKMKHAQSSKLQNQSSYLANSGLFDEASILKLLDQTLSQDITDETQDNQKKSELLESLKYECSDVVEMLTKISQTLKAHYKNNRSGSTNNTFQQKVQIQIGIEEIKQLEILSTSAIQKVREIQNMGENMSKTVQIGQSKHQKDYIEKVRSRMKRQIQKQKSHQKKYVKKMEDEKFKYAINEFELNDRVSQLEDAFNKQQDEINKQANKNEILQKEKQILAKKYEKRMNEIEGNLKAIIHNYLTQDRSNDRRSKVNNSFSVGQEQDSLLLPPMMNSKSKKLKRVDSQKENKEKLQTSDISITQKHNTDKKQSRSLQSQLINLKKMIKEFKKVDTQQQQEGGSCYEPNNSIKNFLSQLINLQNESLAQQSQYAKPESSQASINQAFIQSKNKSDESKSCSNNNTSFFGKDMFGQNNEVDKMKENMSSIISYLISARTGGNQQKNDRMVNQQSSNAYQDDDIQKMFYDQFKDLSMTQQEKLIEEIWMNRKQIDEDDKRDVDINDILEVSKKTINSVDTSMRTGRHQNQSKPVKSQEDQLSILRILKGVSSAVQLHSISDNEKKDKNNSTLEISFNQNEIQVVDGQYQRMLKGIEEDEEIKVNDKMRNMLKLDEKISTSDIMDKAMLELSQKQQFQNKREQILQNNRFFGASLNSDLQMGGGIQSTRRENQQNSVEEDLQILNNINPNSNKKKTQEHLDFPDFSLIEGNNSINLQTAGRQGSLMITGSIHKDGGDSLYSGGDSLLQMNVAFLPPSQQAQVMTIKVQNREIKIPKLDINRVIQLERREPYKYSQNQAQLSSSSSSLSNQEASSFQNESVQKPLQVTDNIDKSNLVISNEKDLDKAIIVEEQDSETFSINKDQEDDIFGTFKQQLIKEENQQNEKDDTLDLDMDNEILELSNKKSSAGKFESFFNKESSPKKAQSIKIEKPYIINEAEPKEVSIQKSQNTSLLKKSQSENQLTNNQDLLLDEKLLNQQNHEDQSSRQNLDQQKKKSTFQKMNFDLKKIKTPKSGGIQGLKFNFGQNGLGLKIVKNPDIIKGRCSSTDKQQQYKDNQQADVIRPIEKQIIFQNCDEDEFSPNKQEVNKSKLIKASFIKLSKVQRNTGNIDNLKSKVNQSLIHQPMNEISCAQDQSVIASSFFQDNLISNQRPIFQTNHASEDHTSQVINKPQKSITIHKIMKQKPQQEDSLIIQPKDNVSLLQNYFSGSDAVNSQPKPIKLRPSSGGKKILKISGNSSINMRNHNDIQDQPYRASSNSIMKISKQNITSSCEFDISDDVNASKIGINDTFQQSPEMPNRLSSKSNSPQKSRISVIRKQVISKVNDQGEQKITLNRISLQKRRISDNNTVNMNQSEIMQESKNQSVIHQQQHFEQNLSYFIPNNDQSVLKGIDDTNIMINNKSINIRLTQERVQVYSNINKVQNKEETKDRQVQQPKIMQNFKVNNLNSSQINSQQSINKINKINQILLNQQAQPLQQQQQQKLPTDSVQKKSLDSKQKVLCNENLHIKKDKKPVQHSSKDEIAVIGQRNVVNSKKKSESTLLKQKSKRNSSHNQTLSSSASMKDL